MCCRKSNRRPSRGRVALGWRGVVVIALGVDGKSLTCGGGVCAPGRDRTYGLGIRSPLLYPLSYGRAMLRQQGTAARGGVVRTGGCQAGQHILGFHGCS